MLDSQQTVTSTALLVFIIRETRKNIDQVTGCVPSSVRGALRTKSSVSRCCVFSYTRKGTFGVSTAVAAQGGGYELS